MELIIKFQDTSEISIFKDIFKSFGKSISAEIINDKKKIGERKSDYHKYSDRLIKTFEQEDGGIFVNDLRIDIAINLFKENILTLGQASEFANLYQVEFMKLLLEQEIPVHYDDEEFNRDVNNIALV